MRGGSGLIGIAAGLLVLILSVFWPENTFLAMMLLTFGALSCSWEGVNAQKTSEGTWWTGVSVITTAFVSPFYAVFGAPVSLLFTLPSGLVALGVALAADRYAGGKDYKTLGSRANWPVLGAIIAVGTLIALLIRLLQ